LEGKGPNVISGYYTGIHLEGLKKTTKNLSDDGEMSHFIKLISVQFISRKARIKL